jgi:hypothetical protein
MQNELNLQNVLELLKAIIEPIAGQGGTAMQLLALVEACPQDKELFLDVARQHGWHLNGHQWSFRGWKNALEAVIDLFTEYINLTGEHTTVQTQLLSSAVEKAAVIRAAAKEKENLPNFIWNCVEAQVSSFPRTKRKRWDKSEREHSAVTSGNAPQ